MARPPAAALPFKNDLRVISSFTRAKVPTLFDSDLCEEIHMAAYAAELMRSFQRGWNRPRANPSISRGQRPGVRSPAILGTPGFRGRAIGPLDPGTFLGGA